MMSPMTVAPGLFFDVRANGSSDLETAHAFIDVRTERGFHAIARGLWRLESIDDVRARVGEIGTMVLAIEECDPVRRGTHLCISGQDMVVSLSAESRPGDSPLCAVSVAADDMTTATRVLEGLRTRLPAPGYDNHLRLPVAFWSLCQYGPDKRERFVDRLDWPVVEENYPASLRDALTHLMAQGPDDIQARLHLWHGPPGTGKTHAVRALGSAWAEWCEVHYITDPEKFFASAEYMMDVVLEESDNWRLVVLEDAGEFLGADASAVTGQGFARLLNLTDGILGYGARTMLLMTTNADLRTLHPATRRPGRAASHLGFTPFDVPSAGEWLQRAGCDTTPDRPLTLAELYAVRDDQGPTESLPARSFGFG